MPSVDAAGLETVPLVLPTTTWTEHASLEHGPYYYNSATGETLWTKPAELLTDEEQQRDSVAAKPAPAESRETKLSRRTWFMSALGWWTAVLLIVFVAQGRQSAEPVASSAPSPTLHFMVVGDWGRQGRYNTTLLAASMAALANTTGYSFVVSTGDNAYDDGLDLCSTNSSSWPAPGAHGNGIRNVSDPFWRATWTAVFESTPPPFSQLPWYAVLGNHDYASPANASAQLDPALDPRWTGFGSSGGLRSFSVSGQPVAPGESSFLDIFFIDTSPWINDYVNAQPVNVSGVLRSAYDFDGIFRASDAVSVERYREATLAALAAQLANCTARWKLAVGHHPVFSYALDHGSTLELAQLNDVLRSGGIHGWMNGHDHNLQLIQLPQDAVNGPWYLTSGAGSRTFSAVLRHVDDSLLFAHRANGFNTLELSRDSLLLHSHGVDGAVLHTHFQAWTASPACGGAGGACLPAPPPGSRRPGTGVAGEVNVSQFGLWVGLSVANVTAANTSRAWTEASQPPPVVTAACTVPSS
jgi:hypothetical protein